MMRRLLSNIQIVILQDFYRDIVGKMPENKT